MQGGGTRGKKKVIVVLKKEKPERALQAHGK